MNLQNTLRKMSEDNIEKTVKQIINVYEVFEEIFHSTETDVDIEEDHEVEYDNE